MSMGVQTLLSAQWLLPVSRPPIHDGAVLIKGGRVCELGPRSRLVRRFPGVIEHSWGEAVIMPGLIDCHAHLEIASILAAEQFSDLFHLMTVVGDMRRRTTPHDLLASRLMAVSKCLRGGVTCVVDWMTPSSQPIYGEPGIRAVRALEVIAPTADDSAHAEMLLAEQIPKHCNGLRVGWEHLALAPHSLYMTGAEMWSHIVRCASEMDLLVTTHFAETKYERRWLRKGDGPLVEHCRGRSNIATVLPGFPGPIELMVSREHLVCRPLLVHGSDMKDDEIAQISETGASLCLCPRSNKQLTGRAPALDRLISADIKFVLGTDSWSGHQDLLGDARCLLAQLCTAPLATKRSAAAHLVRAMTRDAALVLAWPNLGVVEAGSHADFAIFRIHTDMVEDVELELVQSGEHLATFLAGNLVCGEMAV